VRIVPQRRGARTSALCALEHDGQRRPVASAVRPSPTVPSRHRTRLHAAGGRADDPDRAYGLSAVAGSLRDRPDPTGVPSWRSTGVRWSRDRCPRVRGGDLEASASRSSLPVAGALLANPGQDAISSRPTPAGPSLAAAAWRRSWPTCSAEDQLGLFGYTSSLATRLLPMSSMLDCCRAAGGSDPTVGAAVCFDLMSLGRRYDEGVRPAYLQAGFARTSPLFCLGGWGLHHPARGSRHSILSVALL